MEDFLFFSPDCTPYEDGTFGIILEFTSAYPLTPPSVRFEPPIFHPNVYSNGSVCLDILNKAWSPTFSISTILLSMQVSKILTFSLRSKKLDIFLFQALLITPNPNSPA